MSWSLQITANKRVKLKDVDEIVESLPSEFQGALGYTGRTSWGWSTCVDILKPGNATDDNKSFLIRGAGFSRYLALDMARHFQGALEERGYEIKLGNRQD